MCHPSECHSYADATKTGLIYKGLINMIVCYRMCMLHRCPACPGREVLKSFLESHFSDFDDEITFQQWQSTNSMDLIKQSLDVEDFIELIIEAIDDLTSHSFIARCQGRYLKDRKETLETDSVLGLGDFAENYTFVVQDKMQSYHWKKSYCTVHPIVEYYKMENELSHQSFCFLSDDLEHDTNLCIQFNVKYVLTSKRRCLGYKKLSIFQMAVLHSIKTLKIC